MSFCFSTFASTAPEEERIGCSSAQGRSSKECLLLRALLWLLARTVGKGIQILASDPSHKCLAHSTMLRGGDSDKCRMDAQCISCVLLVWSRQQVKIFRRA